MDTTQAVETHLSPDLCNALVQFHESANIILKDGSGNYSPFVTYEQIIKTVRPMMHKQNIFFHHISHPAQGGAAVETVIYGHGGQLTSGIVRIPASKQDEHKYGGAITYAKRYSLMLALGLGGDEDLIEESATEDLPTVVEAQQAKQTESPDAIGTRLFNEADVKNAPTATEARKRFIKFEKGMKARGLEVDKPAFEKYLKERY